MAGGRCLYCFGPLPARKGSAGKPRSKFCSDEHARAWRRHGEAGDGKRAPAWIRSELTKRSARLEVGNA